MRAGFGIIVLALAAVAGITAFVLKNGSTAPAAVEPSELQSNAAPVADGFPASRARQSTVGEISASSPSDGSPPRDPAAPDLRIGRDVLTGRLLDASGEVVAKRPIAVFVRPHGFARFRVETTSDERGEFLAKVPYAVKGAFSVSVARRATRYFDGVSLEREFADLAGTKVDCGDFRIDNGVLVAGKVVDASEAPVAGALIIAKYAWPNQAGGYSYDDIPVIADLPRTDHAGRFEVRGPAQAREITVVAKKDGYVPLAARPLKNRRIPVGAHDLVIRLRTETETGTLTTTLAPRWRHLGGLEARARVTGAEDDRGMLGIFREGTARISSVPATVVDVRISSLLEPGTPLATVLRVTIPKAGEADDPRLRDIELPEIPLLSLKILGPIAYVEKKIRAEASDVDEPRDVWIIRRDQIDVVLGRWPKALEIEARGFRTEVISASPGERTVELRRAARGRFSLNNQPMLPSGVRLALRWELITPTIPTLPRGSKRWPYCTNYFGVAGVIDSSFEVPGRYQGQWIVSAWTEAAGGPEQEVAGAPFKFDVADSDEPQVFELACPITLVEPAAQRLAAQERERQQRR
jgi:hypothetical protein